MTAFISTKINFIHKLLTNMPSISYDTESLGWILQGMYEGYVMAGQLLGIGNYAY